MISDIGTVMWKEYRELKQLLTGTRGQWFGLLIFLGVFGVMMPLQAGPIFVKAPILLILFSFFPLFIVMQIVPDSFAGERERHTLETLLATRLPDGGILLGKMLTIVCYGWTMAMGIECIMLFSVNIVYLGREGLILPPLAVAVASVFAGFLVSMLGTCIGIVVSLKSPTVKQAQQTLAFVVMGLWFLPFMVGPLLIKSIPKETLKPVFENIKQVNPNFVLLGIVILLVVLNAILFRFISKRFQRARLILSS